MAYQMALVSENIRAQVYEVTEFPDLIERYGVSSVPKIVLNDEVEFVGALPEVEMVEEVIKASQKRAA